jgi:ABC-2 type transport system permease protein
MWFTSVFLKTLRDFRIAIFGWGIGMGVLMYAVLSAFPSLVTTAAARASLVSLAASFAWLAEPVQIDTPGGYLTWKYGFTILVMALWPLLVGSRMLRGEEERGSLDALLSLPRTRMQVALQKLAAMWTALLAMGLIIGLLTFGAGTRVEGGINLGDGLLFGLNLALICGVFGSIALLISQFTQERRTASGATGALLVLFIVMDMVHRVFPEMEWLSRLSPVYYYNLSKPLVPSYGTNVGALLVLVTLSVILSAAALALFVRRDIGATVKLPGWLQLPERAVQPEQALPVNAWSLRSIYARSLAKIAVPTFWWTVGLGLFAAFMILVTKQTVNQLQALLESSSYLKNLITKVGGAEVGMSASILSAVYVILPLLLMTFAVTQANRWSADEEEGRQELVLSTPQSRLKVLLGQFGAVATSTVIIAVVTLAVAVLSASAAGLDLDRGNLTAATLSIIPLALLTAALGYLLAGWLTTAVDTGLLSFLLVIWFFITFIGPELNWSESVLRLSAFYYYGTPLVHGLPVGDTIGVLAVAVVALALAAVRFMRKDIAR